MTGEVVFLQKWVWGHNYLHHDVLDSHFSSSFSCLCFLSCFITALQIYKDFLTAGSLTEKILFNSTNQIQYTKEDKHWTTTLNRGIIHAHSQNLITCCPAHGLVGVSFCWSSWVFRVSLTEHYCNGSTFSFYFTRKTFHPNDTGRSPGRRSKQSKNPIRYKI